MWDIEEVWKFAPTWVVNFAFLTPDRLEAVGLDDFVRVNSELTRQFLASLELPTVRCGLAISSGAAVGLPSGPYGELKKLEESAALAMAGPRRTVVVGRAYSLSGPYVRLPRTYAFSDMILQATEGRVRIRAAQPTLRRYVSVEDFLHVCLRSAQVGNGGLIESGGELVEMGELARRIVKRVNPAAHVDRVPLTSEDASVYASDNDSWSRAVEAIDINALSLDAQIDAAAQWLRQAV